MVIAKRLNFMVLVISLLFCQNYVRFSAQELLQGFRASPPTLIKFKSDSQRGNFHIANFDNMITNEEVDTEKIQEYGYSEIISHIRSNNVHSGVIMVGIDQTFFDDELIYKSPESISKNKEILNKVEEKFTQYIEYESKPISKVKGLSNLGMLLVEFSKDASDEQMRVILHDLWSQSEDVWLIEADSEINLKGEPRNLKRSGESIDFQNIGQTMFKWLLTPFLWFYEFFWDNGNQSSDTRARRYLPNDPLFNLQWGLNNNYEVDSDINAPEFWKEIGLDDNISRELSEVVVAVIDTGLDVNHPDIKESLWVNRNEIPNNGLDDDGNGYVDDIHGWNFLKNDNDLTDLNGHGTHCAGVIAAKGNNNLGTAGVFWKAKVMSLKFGNLISQAIEAIEYSLAQKARISSNSWGYSFHSAILYTAMEKTRDADQLFFVAVDNAGRDNNRYGDFPPNWNFENMINIAALAQDGRLAYFSNYGSPIVHVASPGYRIYSTVPNNNYAYKSGTSMATPLAAGVAAGLISAYPILSNREIKQIILSSAKKLPQLNGKLLSGGTLDAYNALQMASAKASHYF